MLMYGNSRWNLQQLTIHSYDLWQMRPWTIHNGVNLKPGGNAIRRGGKEVRARDSVEQDDMRGGCLAVPCCPRVCNTSAWLSSWVWQLGDEVLGMLIQAKLLGHSLSNCHFTDTWDHTVWFYIYHKPSKANASPSMYCVTYKKAWNSTFIFVTKYWQSKRRRRG